MIRSLLEKVDNAQEQMVNISREIGVKKDQEEILEVKKYCNRNEECL